MKKKGKKITPNMNRATSDKSAFPFLKKTGVLSSKNKKNLIA